jgi:hypothetical protein
VLGSFVMARQPIAERLRPPASARGQRFARFLAARTIWLAI